MSSEHLNSQKAENTPNNSSWFKSLGKAAMHLSESESTGNRREKLEKGIKIVIGGPARSGKSVLFYSLIESLPSAYPLKASPDTDGFWYQHLYEQGKGPTAEKYRKKIKGNYSPESREYYKEKINDWNGPLMLIDMGGKLNQEDSSMIRGATHAIILSSDLSEVAPWRKFFEDNDVEVMATIHSRYHDTRDLQLPQNPERGDMIGSIHHLERGESAADKETVKQLVGKINDLVNSNSAYHDMESKRFMNLNILKVPEKFQQLPKDAKNRTSPDAMPFIYEEAAKYDGESAWFDGIRCSWETMAFALAFAENGVKDIRVGAYGSFIPVKPLPEAEEVDQEWWEPPRLFGKLDESPIYVVHNIASNGKKIVYPSDLDIMTVPKVPENATVIISGAGPNWLKASIAAGYKDKVAAIAGFQPGVGSTIVWDKDKKYLGRILEGEIL